MPITELVNKLIEETLHKGIAEIRARGPASGAAFTEHDFSTPGIITPEQEAALVAACVTHKTFFLAGKDRLVSEILTAALFNNVPISSGADLLMRLQVLYSMTHIIGSDAFLAASKLIMAQVTRRALDEIEEEKKQRTMKDRTAKRQCKMCGHPLAFLDKLLGRSSHRGCDSFRQSSASSIST
jgi:hypothetical protein